MTNRQVSARNPTPSHLHPLDTTAPPGREQASKPARKEAMKSYGVCKGNSAYVCDEVLRRVQGRMEGKQHEAEGRNDHYVEHGVGGVLGHTPYPRRLPEGGRRGPAWRDLGAQPIGKPHCGSTGALPWPAAWLPGCLVGCVGAWVCLLYTSPSPRD